VVPVEVKCGDRVSGKVWFWVFVVCGDCSPLLCRLNFFVALSLKWRYQKCAIWEKADAEPIQTGIQVFK